MKEKRYMISDAARLVDVESHVLRYWEDELMVEIPRNEMGHRYYTEFHINLMKQVKDLKERGFQLKAIRMLLPELCEKVENQDSVDAVAVMKEENESLLHNEHPSATSKLEQFEKILENAMTKALKDNCQEFGDYVTSKVSTEMEYLLKLQDERAEERFRKFDERLRGYQESAKERRGIMTRKKRISG